jgi:hypothetical protein
LKFWSDAPSKPIEGTQATEMFRRERHETIVPSDEAILITREEWPKPSSDTNVS